MIPPIALQRKPLVADEAPAPTTMHGSLAVMRNDMVAAGTRPNCPKGHAAAAGSRCDGAGGRAQDRTSATKRRGLQRHYRHGRWVPATASWCRVRATAAPFIWRRSARSPEGRQDFTVSDSLKSSLKERGRSVGGLFVAICNSARLDALKRLPEKAQLSPV